MRKSSQNEQVPVFKIRRHDTFDGSSDILVSSFKNVVFIATRDNNSDGSVSSVHILVASLQNVVCIDTMHNALCGS